MTVQHLSLLAFLRTNDRLQCKLIASLLDIVVERWNVSLLPERIGPRKHRFNLAQVTLLKMPVDEKNGGKVLFS